MVVMVAEWGVKVVVVAVVDSRVVREVGATAGWTEVSWEVAAMAVASGAQAEEAEMEVQTAAVRAAEEVQAEPKAGMVERRSRF